MIGQANRQKPKDQRLRLFPIPEILVENVYPQDEQTERQGSERFHWDFYAGCGRDCRGNPKSKFKIWCGLEAGGSPGLSAFCASAEEMVLGCFEVEEAGRNCHCGF